MQIGMIGLGRTGGTMARCLMRKVLLAMRQKFGGHTERPAGGR